MRQASPACRYEQTNYAPGDLVPDDMDVYEDDEGLYVQGDEGSRIEVEYLGDEPDTPDADDGEDYGDEESLLNDYAAELAAKHDLDEADDEVYLSSDEVDTWFANHPAAAANKTSTRVTSSTPTASTSSTRQPRRRASRSARGSP